MPPTSHRQLVPAMLAIAFVGSLIYATAGADSTAGDPATGACAPTTSTTSASPPTTGRKASVNEFSTAEASTPTTACEESTTTSTKPDSTTATTDGKQKPDPTTATTDGKHQPTTTTTGKHKPATTTTTEKHKPTTTTTEKHKPAMTTTTEKHKPTTTTTDPAQATTNTTTATTVPPSDGSGGGSPPAGDPVPPKDEPIQPTSTDPAPEAPAGPAVPQATEPAPQDPGPAGGSDQGPSGSGDEVAAPPFAPVAAMAAPNSGAAIPVRFGDPSTKSLNLAAASPAASVAGRVQTRPVSAAAPTSAGLPIGTQSAVVSKSLPARRSTQLVAAAPGLLPNTDPMSPAEIDARGPLAAGGTVIGIGLLLEGLRARRRRAASFWLG
jgi:hypothetical protein